MGHAACHLLSAQEKKPIASWSLFLPTIDFVCRSASHPNCAHQGRSESNSRNSSAPMSYDHAPYMHAFYVFTQARPDGVRVGRWLDSGHGQYTRRSASECRFLRWLPECEGK